MGGRSPIGDAGGADGGAIGLLGATAIGIGGMVGGGIFAVLGVAAHTAGGATSVAFLIGGAVAALTAYSHAKLSVAYRSAGGTVAFVDGAFGVNSLLPAIGVVGCGLSLVVLLARSVTEDPAALIALIVVLGATFGFERLFLAGRRGDRPG